jgi:peroxiredoxin
MVLTESSRKLRTGDDMPEFNLLGTDGNEFSSDDMKGKPSLIIFMCNHCPYVKAKIESITALHEKFKGRINVVGINSNDPDYEGEGMDNMKKFAEEKNIQFPYLLDDTQEVAKSYGATCTPDLFLFDNGKKLVFHGRIDNALTLDSQPTEQTMENNIRKILDGGKIEKDFEPSMGCSIKWKG